MKSKVANQLFAGILAVTLVVAGPIAPLSAQAASTKTVTVTNEKQLKAALKNNKVTKITIKTSKNTTITIPVGKYGKKQLVINAPKATISNKGDFKAISISDAKKYTEKGKANKITIKDKNSLSFVESVSATATQVTVVSDGKKLVVTDNGDLTSLRVKAKTDLTVKGTSGRTPVFVSSDGTTLNIQKDAAVKLNADVQKIVVTADARINVAEGVKLGSVVVNDAVKVSIAGATTDSVAVVVNAEGAKIDASTSVDVTANANAEVNLAKGAEGSKISVAKGVDTTVNNQTTEKVDVTSADGTTKPVDAGENVKSDEIKSEDTKSDDKKNEAGNSGTTSGGSSNTGGDTPSAPVLSNFTVKNAEFNSDASKLDVTMDNIADAVFTVDGVTVSASYAESKFELTVSGIKGGVHTLKISKNGYNTYTQNVKYAPTPVIALTPSETAETVFVSDVATLTERTIEVTNYLPNTATIEKKYYEESEGGTEIATWDAVKTYLQTATKDSDKKVVAKYVAKYDGKESTAATVTYTGKADVVATAVEVTGTAKVGETLNATAKGDGDAQAGGGLSYQWQVASDNNDESYKNIQGANAETFVITAACHNQYVRCVVKNVGSDELIKSTGRQITTKGDVTVSSITYAGNSKETALANDSTLDAANLTGTAKCGGVDVAGTWSFTEDSKLTVSKNVKVQFTPNEEAYNVNTEGTVYVYVKAVTPTKLELSTEASSISYGKVKFASKPAENIQYKIGNDGTWTDASDAEFDAKTGDQIYFRTKANGTDKQDGYVVDSDVSDATEVTESNIGSKTISLAQPTALSNVSLNMGTKTLSFNAYTNSQTDATHADSYLIKVYQDETLTATATIASGDTTAALELESDQQFAYDKDYTVTITAKAGSETGYTDSTETTKSAAISVSDRVTVTFSVDDGSSVDPIKMQTGTTATKPADPTKSGYIFIGWYTDTNYTTEFDFNSTNVNVDTTIYALWSKELDAKSSVSFTFPTQIQSNNPGLSDDGNQRLDQALTGSNVAWTNSTCAISGTVKKDKGSDVPMFVSFDITGLTDVALWGEISGDESDFGWVSANDTSTSNWKNAGKLDLSGDGKTVYIKLAKYLLNSDNKSASADTTYIIHVLNKVGADGNGGYEVARLSFTIHSTVTKETE